MTMSSNEKRVVQQIVKTYGPTLDLATHPEVLIEIVRKWGFDLIIIPGTPAVTPDAGVSPGGVGPPTSLVSGPGLDDVLKAIISLQRQVDKISRQLGG